MDLMKCPICNKSHLKKLSGYVPHRGETIVCQNEYTIHIIRGGRHYLARTVVAILEEMENLFVEENRLILN